jgi:hypothetical protein
MWYSLRKTSVSLYLEYGSTYTGNLSADNIEAAAIDFTLMVKFDLNRNLRTRNKAENSFIDAQELAQGKINQLTCLQCDDKHVLSQLMNLLKRLINTEQAPNGNWRLIIKLNGDHEFDVIPEFRSPNTLVLRVE